MTYYAVTQKYTISIYMKHYVIGLLFAVLVIAIVSGMTVYGKVQEGILPDRLASLIGILKTSSVAKEKQYESIKNIGITDPKYNGIISDKRLSPAQAIDKLRDMLKKDGVNV